MTPGPGIFTEQANGHSLSRNARERVDVRGRGHGCPRSSALAISTADGRQDTTGVADDGVLRRL